MKPKHTPGPWKVATGSGWIDDAAQNQVCIFPRSRFIPERAANARLIASAPEMYQALKRINDSGIWADTSLIGIHNAVKAAIAKAEGK